jgi:hypothetical protein
MTDGYRKNKKAIFKWREKNKETHSAYSKNYCSEYNSKHREEINRKTLLNYHYKKQCRIFREILIDEIV